MARQASPARASAHTSTHSAAAHLPLRVTEQVSLSIQGSNRLAGVQHGPSAVLATLAVLCADSTSLPHRFVLDSGTEIWLSTTAAGPVMLRVHQDSARRVQRLDVVPHDQQAFDRQFASDLGVRRTSLAAARNRRTVLALHQADPTKSDQTVHAVGATVRDAWVVLAARDDTVMHLVYYRFDHVGQVVHTQRLRESPPTQIALLLDNP